MSVEEFDNYSENVNEDEYEFEGENQEPLYTGISKIGVIVYYT